MDTEPDEEIPGAASKSSSTKVIDLADLYVTESKAEQEHQKKQTEKSKSKKSLKRRRATSVHVVLEGQLKTLPRERSSSSMMERKLRITSADPLVFGTTNPDAHERRNDRDRERIATRVPATSRSLMKMVNLTKFENHQNTNNSMGWYNAKDCFHLKASSIPTEVRLSVKQNNTNVEKFRKQLPLPPAALPSTSLPEWRIMPLENKIPCIPAPDGTMSFTRGALGQPINVKQKDFVLTDPRNYESKASPSYDSLHDPHAASYLNKPVVQQVLKKNGLINKRGQVVCSLKEFNMYRSYLRTVYNKSLQDTLKEDDSKFKHEFEMKKKLEHHTSLTSKGGRLFLQNERRQVAVTTLQAKRESFLHRIEAKQERDRHLYHCHVEDKIRQRINLALVSLVRTENNRCRLEQLKNAQNLRTQQIKAYIAAKEKAAEERILAERNSILNAYKLFVTEWLLAKFESQEKRLQRDEQVRKCLVNDMEHKAYKRLIRLEHHRAMLGYLNELHQQQEKRMWRIVRKYFNRWRDRVKYLRQLRPDEQHRSMWDVTDSLRKTIEYLMEQTGHSQFKALVFNLKQLKAVTGPKSDENVTEMEGEDDQDQEHEDDSEEAHEHMTEDDTKETVEILKYSQKELREAESRSNTAISGGSSTQFKVPPPPKLKFKSSQYESRKQLRRYSSRAGSRISRKTKLQPLSKPKPSSKKLAEKKPSEQTPTQPSTVSPTVTTNEPPEVEPGPKPKDDKKET